MKSAKVLWTLALANVVLAGLLAWKLTPSNVAHAQRARARGDYIMVPAKVMGANAGVVYMVDTQNAVLSGFVFDTNRQELAPMPPVDLARIFADGGRKR